MRCVFPIESRDKCPSSSLQHGEARERNAVAVAHREGPPGHRCHGAARTSPTFATVANLSRPTAASPSLLPLRPCAPAPPMPSPKDPRAAMIAMSAPRPSLLAVTPPLSPLRRLRRIVRHLAHLPLPVQEGLRHPPSRSPSMFPAPHHVLPNRSPCRIPSRGSLCAAPHASGSSVTLLAHFSVASLFLLRAFPSTWLLPSSPMPSTANHVPPIS